MTSDNKKQYNCSYITNIPWLTVSITLLNFASLGHFLINLRHSHPFMELLYVQAGKLCVQLPDSEFFLEKGDLLYLNAQVPHIITPASEEQVETYNMSFLLTLTEPTERVPPEWIEDERLLLKAFFNHDYLTARDLYGCGEELARILASIDSHRRGELIRVRGCISNFIMAALQSFSKISPNPSYEETLTGDLSYNATKLLFYIQEHFTEGLTLSSVAEALHYSTRQCQRIIQETMNVSFSSLLLELQLSYAKALLSSTDASLESVSEAAGFPSSRSLYRYFKEQEGLSPQQYRKNLQSHTGFPPNKGNLAPGPSAALP
ncbi:MAG: AraC family transcriptional regulator [Lachnospiraceae bacterium]|nr:AraC family transcriptional regulator [Lachnospiraceae bacterium]MCI8995984.1 AraC family transcriptional regulator [Lachnospiraceae bacterium]